MSALPITTIPAPGSDAGPLAESHGAERAPERNLLERYRPGSSSFFASPGGDALLGEGVAAVLPAWSTGPSRADRAMDLLDDARRSGHPDPVALGALPFDEDLPARIVVPAVVRRGRTSALAAAISARQPAVRGPVSLLSVTPHAAFVASVAEAVGELTAGPLRKVVLSRALELSAASDVDAAQLLRNLMAGEPASYAFAIDLPRAVSRASDGFPPRATRTLVGASPELLLRRRGAAISTFPLAGSTPRRADRGEDRVAASALLGSAKDAGEHAVVVEAIGDALAPLCRRLTVPARPSLVSTGAMWHLGTAIEGELRSDVSSLHAALALHPTPAICGTPAPAARATIARLEPYRRDFYTGLVGWTDATGDGDWAVTIRCAQVEGRGVRLYAGAGIMADSDPEAELAETSAKARTFLTAMGIDLAEVARA